MNEDFWDSFDEHTDLLDDVLREIASEQNWGAPYLMCLMGRWLSLAYSQPPYDEHFERFVTVMRKTRELTMFTIQLMETGGDG